MFIRKAFAGLAAAGLILGSTVATAAPADRSASKVSSSEKLEGTGTFTILLGVLIVAGILGIVLSNDKTDTPTSP